MVSLSDSIQNIRFSLIERNLTLSTSFEIKLAFIVLIRVLIELKCCFSLKKALMQEELKSNL